MLVYKSKYISRFVTDKMRRQFETFMRRRNCMWTKCMKYWMFDILGIWRSTQDTSICGCPCSGSGGWCDRGWPLWCPERIWWNQVTLKLCRYYELKNSIITQVEFHLNVLLFLFFCMKLCGVDAQEAPGFGGVCRHEWIIHSCNLRCWQPSVHCWSPSLYQLLNKPEDIQARRLRRLQKC